MPQITVSTADFSLSAQLNDSPTARLIWEALPFEGRTNVWGDEIYFEIPVSAGEAAGARELVEVGDLGYWPPGRAFCIFFGPTPVSRDERPRAYSPVNVLGRIEGDARRFEAVRQGDRIDIRREER